MDNLWSFLSRNKIRWTRIERIAPEKRYRVYLQSGASFTWEYDLPGDIFSGDSGLPNLPADKAWKQDSRLIPHPTPEAEAILGIQS